MNKKGKEIYTVVQPDLCIICDTEKIDRLGCLGAPDMIVEVLSPSTMMKDITIKYSLYESEKVKEYWVVNPDLYSINTFVLNKKGKYEETGVHEWYKDAEMPAPIVPVHIFKGDLKIDFNTVFE